MAAGGSSVPALIAERQAFLDTVASLDDAHFTDGPTLCAGWAPRDVFAHVLGEETHLGAYLRAGGAVNRANARIVAAHRGLTRAELMRRGAVWAARPSRTSRIAAGFLLGDLVVHHQDVLQPLGRTRDIPEPARRAMLREGSVLGVTRLRRYRVEPTDLAGAARGRGTVLTGTAEALAMWLAGRDAYRDRLTPVPGPR